MTMVKPELLDYIKKQLSYGHDAPTIREHLLKHGYTETVADDALHSAVPVQKTKIPGLKYLPFSGKKMTIAFLVFVVLGGIGFALFQMLAGGGDLAGAATEPVELESLEEMMPEEQEEGQDQEPDDELIEETEAPEESEEMVDEAQDEMTEETGEEETSEETTEESEQES